MPPALHHFTLQSYYVRRWRGLLPSATSTTARRMASVLLALLPLLLQAATDGCVWHAGGIVRGDTVRKRVALVFTADSWGDGEDDICKTLKSERVKASFFFTGRFCERHPETVVRLRRAHHYVGTHGYAHLLYCDFGRPDSLLVTQAQFQDDIRKGYAALAQAGIKRSKTKYFIPPYEHYNAQISRWAQQMGLQIVNFTAGSGSNADYTIPSMKSYRDSRTILKNILDYEARHGLNGHFLLMHFGTHPERTDKFYRLLPELIRSLKERGYKFVKVNKMVEH